MGTANLAREVVPGEVVGGKWRVVRLIGRGGMGSVFEGQNIAIGKKVALKFIDAEYAGQADAVSRFQREAEAASVVESAHIVHVFDSGTTDQGIPYIVMELLQGEDLRTRLTRLGKLPPVEAVHIATQVLRGLARAHGSGIVHRDLKPDNVFLVDRDDDPLFVKIVDFGISKFVARESAEPTETLTRRGMVLGTPLYMSPEQARAVPDLDERTDLWSLGAILYECVSGARPFDGDGYESIIVSICSTEAADIRSREPSLSPELADIIHRALARDRGARFRNAREMLQALEGAPLEAAPSAWRGKWIAVGAALLLGAFFATLTLLRDGTAVSAPSAAALASQNPAAPLAASPASTGAAEPERAHDIAPPMAVNAAVTAPAASVSASPPAATVARSKKRLTTLPASQTPAAPSAKPGVATGLQIKTTYP